MCSSLSLLSSCPLPARQCPSAPSGPHSPSELDPRDPCESPLHLSTRALCLSSVMEILPLLLLLSMGVIISTTCAKYTFHPAHLNQSHEQVALLQSAPVSSDLRHDGPLSEGDSGQPDPESPHHAGQPQHPLFAQLAKQYSVMRLRWLSNSSVTCNDGTRAGYYVRHSPSSRRWLIYLEGGWYCMSKATCDQRWAKMREYMTSFRWSQVKSREYYYHFHFPWQHWPFSENPSAQASALHRVSYTRRTDWPQSG